MNWSYNYPANEAIHRPTKLSFSVTYDPIRPDRRIKLTSEKPENISDAEVEKLIKELDQLIQDKYLKNRMEALLHGEFSGEFALAAKILEQETKKKVSTRTLQAWMMPSDRPSSRRCPEWAVVALEEYIEKNPGQKKWLRELSENRQRTRNGRAQEHETALRDRELLRNAEGHLAREDAIRKKWQGTAIGDISAQLADLEISALEKVESHSGLLIRILASLRECDNFEDFKREVQSTAEKHYASERQLKDTARDIRERRKEFASDDGTFPIQNYQQ